MLSTIVNFLKNHLDDVIYLLCVIVFILVNIIQYVKNGDTKKVKVILQEIPSIINLVEELSTTKKMSAIEKKAAAESMLIARYGKKFVDKYIGLLDDAIEDILSTPQKKGGSFDAEKKD